MTLRELYNELKAIAFQVPDIRGYVENDVLRLNTMRDIKYGVFALQQESHTSYEDKMVFSLNLYYIDRLVNSAENEVGIQSHGVEVLRAILNKVLEKGVAEVENIRYYPFTFKFQDLYAGAFANASFIVPLSDCNEIFLGGQ